MKQHFFRQEIGNLGRRILFRTLCRIVEISPAFERRNAE
jgi:hypothetical protein